MQKLLLGVFLVMCSFSAQSASSIPFPNLTPAETNELVALVVQDVQLSQQERALESSATESEATEDDCESERAVSGLIMTSFAGKT